MSDTKNILAFGEILWDLLPSGRKLGGAPFNFAFRATSLGDRGWIVSRLGRDELGKEARQAVEALDMDGRGLQWDEVHPTGTVDIEFGPDGEPDYTINPRVAYDFVETTPTLLDLADRADCICFGTLAQRLPVSRATCRALLEAGQDALKLLDINLRKDCFGEQVIRESLAEADVLKLNDDELRRLAPMLNLAGETLDARARSMREQFGLDCCVVTLGAAGSLAAGDDGVVYVPGYTVTVEDTVGSGDAFTAGFVHEYLRGRALARCCRTGNAVGALVAGQAGGTGGLEMADVEAFLVDAPELCVDASFESLRADP
jgi:fructokinase